MDNLEPFIYGETPLITSLNKALNLFSAEQYMGYRKFLFIISDGSPTDGDKPPTEKLNLLGVQIISCYVTQKHIDNPRQLFSTKRTNWDKATNFMFNISSGIKTQEIPRTVFIKRDWNVEETHNITKLFVQINHPDLLREVTDFARNVITSKHALADVLASINLDCYINRTIKEMEPKLQVGGTCYAYAVAAVLHLAMHRIEGRDDGYPEFEDLKNKIIGIYGEEGAKTKIVLKEMCLEYKLHAIEVDLKEALFCSCCKATRSNYVFFRWKTMGRVFNFF